jgi:hypothetical protein
LPWCVGQRPTGARMGRGKIAVARVDALGELLLVGDPGEEVT